MHMHYNALLVCLSYAVSVLGSFTALQLALGIPLARNPRQRAAAVLAAGTAMGGGAIWTMHFIAMLACHMGVQVSYDAWLTAISALLAIVACSLGLATVSMPHMRFAHLMGASVLMGAGVAGMHYLGMMAMLTSARVTYDLGMVAWSVAIAVFASMAALWLAFNLRGWLQMLGSALVMGVAVCGMHFVGMSALILTPSDSLPVGFEQGLRGDRLGLMTFVAAVLMLALALAVSILHQQRRAAVTI